MPDNNSVINTITWLDSYDLASISTFRTAPYHVFKSFRNQLKSRHQKILDKISPPNAKNGHWLSHNNIPQAAPLMQIG